MSFKELKVVYFPESADSVKLLKLGNPRTGNVQSFVLGINNQSNDDDQKTEIDAHLYELEVYNGHNPHDSKDHLRTITKKEGKPVRSMVLESERIKSDGEHDDGLILEQSELYICKKFNFAYVLISYFYGKPGQGRYQTLEDLIDLIQESIPSIGSLPEKLLADALNLISESIEEGDQQFYKYSEVKTFEFLQKKVELIKESFPKGIYAKLIKPLLNPLDINEEIPTEIEKLAKLRYSIYLLSSYLLPEVQNSLTNKYNFEELDKYINKLETDKRQKRLAEEQINDLNSINATNKRNLEQVGNIKKKPTPAKKVVKKVSMGPLDGFFKKK